MKEKQQLRRFSEEQASNYIKQVTTAVKYLHSKNVIHRDIKPENLLEKFGVIKLSDFGWSVHTEQKKRKTVCGTTDYLSPEMLTSQGYSAAVDVWCIGVLTYELCSGSPPFEQGNANQTRKAISQLNFSMKPYFSMELIDFIKKILILDQTKRIKLEEMLQHPWILKHITNNQQWMSQKLK